MPDFSGIDVPSFEHGFMFLLHVASSMGVKLSLDELAAKLTAIRDGDESLVPSPLDAIRAIENDFGKELPPILRESVHKMMGHRGDTDKFNREAAASILKMMGL